VVDFLIFSKVAQRRARLLPGLVTSDRRLRCRRVVSGNRSVVTHSRMTDQLTT